MTTESVLGRIKPIAIGPTWQKDADGNYILPNITLGWDVLAWAAVNLLQPDGPNAGNGWEFTNEQARFTLWWYSIDETGRFNYRSGVLRRLKGAGKDPFAAVLGAVELAGPCRFGGWDASGSPVAIPHSAPLVQMPAVSKDQTRNTMSLFPGLFSAECIKEHGIDLGKEIIYSATGRLEAVTSSPRTLEGARSSMVFPNETHHWLANNDGHEMAKVIKRNLAKSRDGSARALSLTNAHNPGEDSVAEQDYEAYLQIAAGLSKSTDFLYDSLEAPEDIEFDDDDVLREALIAARGDAEWLDVDRLVAEIRDPRTPNSMARRFYLNQLVPSEDAWITPGEWKDCEDTEKEPQEGDLIAIGFDGSIRDDATALVACRLTDGHIWPLGIWERPENAPDDWEVPRGPVDAALAKAFERYKVNRVYCDPPHWQDTIDNWAGEYGDKIVFHWWTNRPKAMAEALERFHTAVVLQEMTHSGSPLLAQHVSNARCEDHRSGTQIRKEHPKSKKKIDAAMAATLAFEARGDAIEDGALKVRRRRVVGW